MACPTICDNGCLRGMRDPPCDPLSQAASLQAYHRDAKSASCARPPRDLSSAAPPCFPPFFPSSSLPPPRLPSCFRQDRGRSSAPDRLPRPCPCPRARSPVSSSFSAPRPARARRSFRSRSRTHSCRILQLCTIELHVEMCSYMLRHVDL